MRIIKPLLTVAVLALLVFVIYQFFLIPAFFPFNKLVHIVSADTMLVQNGDKLEKVRLIGVDGASVSGNPECVNVAKFALSNEIFKNQRDVSLVKDGKLPDRDANGYLLRYVYLKNNDFVNQKLLEKGIAQAAIIDQPYQFKDQLQNAASSAKSKQLGIWNTQSCTF